MCRTPVFRRPARNIILNHVLESVGLAASAANVESATRTELDSMWTKIFPPEPKSWVVHDEADNVNRCPNCGCEVDYGECDQCGATFSVAGSDVSDLSVFDYEDRVDLGGGLLLDRRLAALDAEREERHNEFRRIHRQRELQGFVDDEAEDDEDDSGLEEEDLYDAHLLRTLDAADGYGSEGTFDDEIYSSGSEADNDGSSIVMGPVSDGGWPSSPDGHVGHDDIDSPGYRFSSSPPPRFSSPSPPPRAFSLMQDVPRRSRARRHQSPAPSDITNTSYESSFINDDEVVEVASDDGLDEQDGSINAADRSEVEDLADDGSDRSEVDEPSIDELRRRRAARYG
jgi:hypothetical protein